MQIGGSNPSRGTFNLKSMSNSKLHKLKGKSQRNVIEKLPFEVKKFFDRKCGSIDSKLTKKEVKDKEIKKEDKIIKERYY